MAFAMTGSSCADEFTDADLQRFQQQFMATVAQGRELWISPKLGSNGVACAQCHPNAANTHPETYPKFQKQLGKVIPLWEMLPVQLLLGDQPTIISQADNIRVPVLSSHEQSHHPDPTVPSLNPNHLQSLTV